MATLDAPAGSARFGAASTLLGQEWAAEPSPVKRRASEALRDHNDGVATQQAAYAKRRKTWSDAQAAIPQLVASMWRPCQASSRQYPTPLELYAMESSVDAENLLEHVEGLLEKWKGLGDDDKKPFVDASKARADAWRAAAAKASIITDELKHATVSKDLRLAIQKGRTAKGLTQKQLATQLNMQPAVINEYESGKAVPNNAVIAKIEKALGCKLPRAPKK